MFFVGVLGIVLLAPAMYGAEDPVALLLLGAGVVLLLSLWVVRLALVGEAHVMWSFAHTALALLVVLAVGQLIPWPVGGEQISLPGGSLLLWRRLTRDPAATAEAAFKSAVLLGFFFLITATMGAPRPISRSTGDPVRILSIVLIGTGAALSLLGILDALSDSGPLFWSFAQGAPSFGPYANRAHFAALIEMVLPLALALLLARRFVVRRRRGRGDLAPEVMLVFSIVLMGTAVAVARSRAGIVLVALQLLVVPYVVVRLVRRGEGGGPPGNSARSILLWIGILGGLVLIGSAGLGGDAMRTHLIERFREGSGGVRWEIWRATLRMIADHPLGGVGLGAFATVYPHYDPSNGLRHTTAAHNDFLQCVAEMGVGGGLLGVSFVLFLARLVGRVLSQGVSRTDDALAVGAGIGIGTVLLHGLVDFGLQITANALIFLSLLAVVLRAACCADPRAVESSARGM